MRSQASAQERVAEQNQDIARDRAAFDAKRMRRETNRRLAAARARIGASGVGFAGSPLEALADARRESELNAMTVEFGGEAQARRSAVAADTAGSRATGAIFSGVGGVGSSLLTGAAQGAFG